MLNACSAKCFFFLLFLKKHLFVFRATGWQVRLRSYKSTELMIPPGRDDEMRNFMFSKTKTSFQEEVLKTLWNKQGRLWKLKKAVCANKLLAFVRWETISPDKKPFQKEILLVLSNKQGRLRKTKRCLCNRKVNLCEVRNHLTRKEMAFLKCANVFKKQRKKTSHSFWKEIGSYHLTEKRDNMFLKWHLLMFSSYSWKANAYWSSERVLKSRYKFLCDSDPHC